MTKLAAGAPRIEAHTDGACSGNPGPGGWGAVLVSGGHRRELCGGEPDTTSNRMELTAAIEALSALKRPSRVRLCTDSKYLRDGATEWLPRWKSNGWRTFNRKPVRNADLWRRLDALAARHAIEWRWVKGHDGDPENERADALARAAVPQLDKAQDADASRAKPKTGRRRAPANTARRE